MIDIKFLRENPDIVKENIKKKFQDAKLPLVDEVIALDAESRKTQQEADNLRGQKNKIAKQIGGLMGMMKKAEAAGDAAEAEAKLARGAAEVITLAEAEEREAARRGNG